MQLERSSVQSRNIRTTRIIGCAGRYCVCAKRSGNCAISSFGCAKHPVATAPGSDHCAAGLCVCAKRSGSCATLVSLRLPVLTPYNIYASSISSGINSVLLSDSPANSRQACTSSGLRPSYSSKIASVEVPLWKCGSEALCSYKLGFRLSCWNIRRRGFS